MNTNKLYFSLTVTSSTRKLVQPCRYGSSCYRKNPDHFCSHSHPHTNMFVRLYNAPSYFALQNRIASIYDCTNVDFTIFYSGVPLASDDDYFFYVVDSNLDVGNNIIPLVVHFTSKNVEPSYCSSCLNYIQSNHFYECNQCSHESYILCDHCESQNVELGIHNSAHIFSKIYPHQQHIKQHVEHHKKSPSPSVDDKLSEIIQKIDSLHLKPKEEKKSEKEITLLREAKKSCLEYIKEMGFDISLFVVELVMKYDGNKTKVLSSLLDE